MMLHYICDGGERGNGQPWVRFGAHQEFIVVAGHIGNVQQTDSLGKTSTRWITEKNICGFMTLV